MNIQRRSGLTEEQWRTTVGPYLHDILRTGAYPQLSRVIHEATDLDNDVRFERGLTHVLNGLKGLVS
ncbi:hypothetical protein G4Z16_00670 [Streptomyces bathyalis]|uniref:Tetracycline repressor TetR C-terminal domain-containing protein n=1 Tax=Streptomyces bathyalis TaxID=2710756 RepID=A0A7T1T2E1_9ACTN|nr:TetR/AcrR family transcriptional regulator C-terminal domain-containing protein [Streptomyces bathyalis]QPP05147.1 hypothetical protein G4Z16_00670 [Streptomyces bathyalis]